MAFGFCALISDINALIVEYYALPSDINAIFRWWDELTRDPANADLQFALL
jgi:hypothetical protein